MEGKIIKLKDLQTRSWENIITELVQDMDPWNINVAQLSTRFLEEVRELETLDFRLPGKLLFIAAVLLRMKSEKLHDMVGPEAEEALAVEIEEEIAGVPLREIYVPGIDKIMERQDARNVTLTDLVQALRDAIKQKDERSANILQAREDAMAALPDIKPVDISKKILEVYQKIMKFFKGVPLSFSLLVKDADKKEKIVSFVSLLHLSQQGKIDISQKEFFEQIYIMPAKGASHKSF